MPPKGHAILSASSSERWLNCPPSARLCEAYEDKGSDYAAEGTDAHALCEFRLKQALGIQAESPIEALAWYSEEMEDCAAGYAAYVVELLESAKQTCSDPVVLIEQRVDFSRWVQDGFGTADCIVGRYIPDSQFNCGVFKWFYMGRLTNGNVRLLGKHIHDGCIYEVVMFDPMSISVSTEKPFCGIISVKKVIELFPAAERIPDSMYDNSYHHGGYFYDCNTTNADYVPQEEKEKLRQDWEDNPQWLAYFPYVIGDKIHIVATSRCHIHHYIFSLSDYSQISKNTIETDTLLQMYGVGFKYERISNSSSQYRWFYGAGVNGDYRRLPHEKEKSQRG